MIDPDLLKILCCPETHQEVRLAEPAVIDKLNGQIAAGALSNRAGQPVKEKIDGGLDSRRRQVSLSDPAEHPRDAGGRGHSAGGLTPIIAHMKLPGIGLLVCGAWLTAVQSPAQVEYVDPNIGGVGFLLEPTRPTVPLPNSMVRVYPVRRDRLDDQIHSFPLTIISHRLGELFWLMPSDGSRTRTRGIAAPLTTRRRPRLTITRRALTTR